MAVKTVRALINNADFPFAYTYAGRTVLDLTDLNARMPGSFYGSQENVEYGVPQLIYCENILPYAKGIFSVGFGQQAQPYSIKQYFGASIADDPDFGACALLLYFDGADNSTTLVDSSPSPVTFTVYGDAKIAADIKLAGSGAGKFDGVLDAWDAPLPAKLQIRTNMFTIEGAAYLTGLGVNRHFIQLGDSGAAGGFAIRVGATNQLEIIDIGGAGYTLGGNVSFTAGTMIRWAVTRDAAGTIRGFINGTLLNNPWVAHGVDYAQSTAERLTISGPGYLMAGRLDDIRVYNGVCKYVADYAMPPLISYTLDSTAFNQAIILRDSAENLTLFSPGNGQNYTYKHSTDTWSAHSAFTFTGELVTRAYVNGRTLICYEGTKVIEYNAATDTFSTLTLILPAGYTMADIRGIGSAQNYLLAFTKLEVLWCSPLNILDFSDIDRGAGGQIPTDIKGQITALLSVSGGFIVYTARNAIGATFTNQAAAPFVFSEIKNAGGVNSFERVTADAHESGHYAWTSVGMQKISLQAAIPFAPQLTDFLVGQNYETWNPTTKEVELSEIGSAYSVRVNYVAGRYVVISYGQERNKFDAAFFFDVALQRWGKVVISHSDVFMYPYPTSAGNFFYDDLSTYFYDDLGENTYDDLDVVRVQVTPPKHGIAFLQNDGSIYILATDFTQSSSQGVAIFGHFQATREAKVTLQGFQLEGTGFDVVEPTVTVLASQWGMDRTWTYAQGVDNQTTNWRRYACRITGENVDIALEGNFVLSGLMANVGNHGYR